MEHKTTEFSFTLKPTLHGVGVFAVNDIKSGTHLWLFRDETAATEARILKNDAVPPFFRQYCVSMENDMLFCPSDFGHMEIGWYLNHSKTPNASHKNYEYYAIKDIMADEEITIDYNTLQEPEECKDDYYN